eukprot:TRINITY_DN5078_c0_g1_i1.p1 TRINITY_DN5078_c0_g1~~TRINITY_DN5078_c0_g1_i1.p1  ORF type:complete len:202 (+),score=44.61 TRINITY_DN5078_c0_g1_i1:209-814(+)
MESEWESMFEGKRTQFLGVIKSELTEIENSIDTIYETSKPIMSEISSLESMKSELLSEVTRLEKEITTLTKEKENVEHIWEHISTEIEKAKYKIKLNVGGSIFVTSKTTLSSQEGSYFYGLLSNGNWKPDEDGEYFIDRNPMVFDRILDFMRDGQLDTRGLDDRSISMLNKDMDYYCLTLPKNENTVHTMSSDMSSDTFDF